MCMCSIMIRYIAERVYTMGSKVLIAIVGTDLHKERLAVW